MPNVALFVVPASQIYRYAAIALGVEVSRVPALVVMRPRNLSGGTPQASVTYGFHTAQGVVQAVRDAEYNGPAATYHAGLTIGAVDPYPDHLRPVPAYGEYADQAVAEMPPPQEGVPGLTAPLHRGHSRGLVTDVLVELGYATPESVQAAVEQARLGGVSPESLLLDQGLIRPDQADPRRRRALRARLSPGWRSARSWKCKRRPPTCCCGGRRATTTRR